MTTLFVPTRTQGKITVVIDEHAAYVDSPAGQVLTANILREIADDLDRATSAPGDPMRPKYYIDSQP